MLGEGTCLFIMLNPSTADEHLNDPTVTRCIDFARQWGFRYLEVVNIFAVRGTDPHVLREVEDPVGPENNRHILEAVEESDRVIFAWGAHGVYMDRGDDVLRLVTALKPAQCLGFTQKGQPRHPLFLKKTIELVAVPMVAA